MRLVLAAAVTLVLASCASVQQLPNSGLTSQPAGPYYGPGPYARYADKSGDQAHFAGMADQSVPVNYGVYDYKSWSDAGTFGRLTAWNNTDRPICVEVEWDSRPYNAVLGSGPVVLPPRANNYVIGYWDTKYVVNNFPGYKRSYWYAPASGAVLSVQDCIQARPAR